MSNLNKIINLGSGSNHGIRSGAAINRRVRPDFNVVFDQYAAELRYLLMRLWPRSETEPILTDPHAGMNDDPVSKQTEQQRGTGAYPAVITQHHARADHGVRANPASTTELGTWPDDRARFHRAIVAKARRRVNKGAIGNAGLGDNVRVERLSDSRIGPVGLRRQQQSHPIRRPDGEVSMDHTGPRFTPDKALKIAPVVEEADLP